MLYGGNTFGTTGWANGECWLLDLDKALILTNMNPDKGRELISTELGLAKDRIIRNLPKAMGGVSMNLRKVKRILDIHLAADTIYQDLERAKQPMKKDPRRIWTQVSSHTHLPRVYHRDATFSAFHLYEQIK